MERQTTTTPKKPQPSSSSTPRVAPATRTPPPFPTVTKPTGLTTAFKRLGIQASAAFNQGGQFEQARLQLVWAHGEQQAMAIAKTDDYPRQHALVFSTLLAPPSFNPRTPTLNGDDIQALRQVCQAWLQHGKPLAALELVCAIAQAWPEQRALVHELLCSAANAMETLPEGLPPARAQDLVSCILRLAERGWTDKTNTDAYLPATLRDRLEKWVNSLAPEDWRRLCLITAQQRVHAGQPLSSALVRKHLRRMETLFDSAPQWRDAIVACALSLAALCPSPQGGTPTPQERARQLQARHEDQQSQAYMQAMSDWLVLDIAAPADLTSPGVLNVAAFKTDAWLQLDPATQEEALRTFRAWLMLQAQSPQGIDSPSLLHVMKVVAGQPLLRTGMPLAAELDGMSLSRDWIPLAFEMELTLAGVQRDQARGQPSAGYLDKLLDSKPGDFKLSAAQLSQALAVIGHATVDSHARFWLLSHLLSWLPPRALAPQMHRQWLTTVLAPATNIDLNLRHSLIEIHYLCKRHPLDQDDASTKKLYEMLNLHQLSREENPEASPDQLQNWFGYLVKYTQEPGAHTDWTVWRPLASAWLREMALTQNPQPSTDWTVLINTALKLARADPSAPQECSARWAELLHDTVAPWPREQALDWLLALSKHASARLSRQLSKTSKADYPAELAALCGAAHALIHQLSDPRGDTPPVPEDWTFEALPKDEPARVIELFRQYAHAALLRDRGQAVEAAALARRITSTMHMSAHFQSPLFPGLYELFTAMGQSYAPSTGGDEASLRWDPLKV